MRRGISRRVAPWTVAMAAAIPSIAAPPASDRAEEDRPASAKAPAAAPAGSQASGSAANAAAGNAAADPAAGGEEPRVTRARALFVEGTELAAKMRWGEALAKFETSARLHAHPGTTYNIGVCERALGRFTRARKAFRAALADGERLPPAMRGDAKVFVRELNRVLARVTVTLSPKSASLSVDGRPLERAAKSKHGLPVATAGTRPAGRAARAPAAKFIIVADPGHHVLLISRAGYADVIRRIDLAPGARKSLTLRLKRMPGELSINASERGAVVTVDGLDVGVAPVNLTRPAGRYDVLVRKPGFSDYATRARLTAGGHVELDAKLEQQPVLLTERWWFWAGDRRSRGGSGGRNLLRNAAGPGAAGGLRGESGMVGADPVTALPRYLVVAGLTGLLLPCCQQQPPPFGEATLYVDTDLPVPEVVSRLRIDLYSESGQWLDSRDIARPDPRDWPVSFTVFTEDETRGRQLWARLRVYPEGRVRDYLGERFWDWGSPRDAAASATNAPRLSKDGADITPAREPLPWLTVDRLVRIELQPGQTGGVPLLLGGECAGTMARLATDGASGPRTGEAQSCVTVERQRETVNAVTAREDAAIATSAVGSFRRADCSGGHDINRVCVLGGATILGQVDLIDPLNLAPVPERVVTHRAFLIDRHEVSVARFRAALQQGFVPSVLPTAQDGPLGGSVASSCSYSSTPLDREQFALSCVTWATAREFCQFSGGDLPTEAEWEYAATHTIGRGRSRYPWGDDPPSCQRAIYGRLPLAGLPGVCESLGTGPAPLDAAAEDVTVTGIVGLGGGVSEWTLDAPVSYADGCWELGSMHDPNCAANSTSERVIRGGSWASPPPVLRSAMRLGVTASGAASFIGFRCVYPSEEAS